MARRKHPSISDEVLDQLLAGGGDPRDTLAGKDGLLDALKKALAERALNAEMDHHLGFGEADGRTNSRNGCRARDVCPQPEQAPMVSGALVRWGFGTKSSCNRTVPFALAKGE